MFLKHQIEVEVCAYNGMLVLVHCQLCVLTPSVRVLSVAPALLKACVYNSFLSSKASSFDHTWFLSGCNEPQHLKEENRTIKKGPWQVEAQNEVSV